MSTNGKTLIFRAAKLKGFTVYGIDMIDHVMYICTVGQEGLMLVMNIGIITVPMWLIVYSCSDGL